MKPKHYTLALCAAALLIAAAVLAPWPYDSLLDMAIEVRISALDARVTQRLHREAAEQAITKRLADQCAALKRARFEMATTHTLSAADMAGPVGEGGR